MPTEMPAKPVARIFSLVFLLYGMSWQQANAQSDMQRLGYASGAYIASGYMLTTLKNSECGYAYKAEPKSGQQRFEELLSVLKDGPRRTLAKELSPELKNIENWASTLVKDEIQSMKKEYDKNTSCGLLVGMILGVVQKQEERWQSYLRSGSPLLK